MTTDITVSVSEFVALLNQTLEYAYPSVTVTGELANFKVSKGKWLYFDLKDEAASVRFFGTVYQLPGPLEDGMMLNVRGLPRLHPLYGFSVSVQSIMPVGEGSIKKAATLLEAKLAAEGLFDEDRKRALPYPPRHVGLITSGESAAYRDFIKIINARWGGLKISHVDVQVQGDAAVGQVAAAISQFNQISDGPEVVVITRGGGSADDLAAFSTEQVTRAVAASRIPTLVAIGHEIDTSLAELAADVRASTPSNAAELLVPDRQAVMAGLDGVRERLAQAAVRAVHEARRDLTVSVATLYQYTERALADARRQLGLQRQLLAAYDPQAALHRGYALVRKGETLIRSGREVTPGDRLDVHLADALLETEVKKVIIE